MMARISTPLKPKGAFSYPSSLERVLAQMSEHKRADRRYPQQSTERGRDKRAQGAARSVGCFCFRFSPIRQRAVSVRNVRAIISTLLSLSFPHIAEFSDG
jgi:hypothetical protein